MKKLIIAMDFDGTLVEDVYPDIGKEDKELIDMLIALQKYSRIDLILWTCREGKELEEAVKYCHMRNIHLDAVNENVLRKRDLECAHRKPYADFYIDDKSPGSIAGFKKLFISILMGEV